jgi:hypothetical protein
MRHGMAMRFLASLVAALFVLATIQPLYGDPCPHHQPALAALAQAIGTAHHGGFAAGHHAALPGSSHGSHGSPANGDSGASHSCHCMGACCGAAPVAIAQQPEQWVPAAVAERIRLAASAPVIRAPRASAPHTLPDSTAPPSALLA